MYRSHRNYEGVNMKQAELVKNILTRLLTSTVSGGFQFKTAGINHIQVSINQLLFRPTQWGKNMFYSQPTGSTFTQYNLFVGFEDIKSTQSSSMLRPK